MTYHLGHFTVRPNGTLDVQSVALTDDQVGVAGFPAELFGGNESSRILLGRQTFSGYGYVMLDVDSLARYTVTGLYPSSGSNEHARLAVFSQGSTYILMNYTDTVVGPQDLDMQRYVVAGDGTATPVGPHMLLPNIVTAERPFDYYQPPSPGDVWDDGDFVAVGFLYWRDVPYNDVSLMLAIFNFTNPTPLHVLTLHHDPTRTISTWDPTTITFAKSGDNYTVSYARMSKRPVPGSTESEEWLTYVTRDINPATGELGDEVFGSDSDYGGLASQLIRADGASTLAYIERYPQENTYPSKIVILSGEAGGASEGTRTLVPWHGFAGGLHGTTNAYAWVGVNGAGAGGYGGRLYFKYRRP